MKLKKAFDDVRWFFFIDRVCSEPQQIFNYLEYLKLFFYIIFWSTIPTRQIKPQMQRLTSSVQTIV